MHGNSHTSINECVTPLRSGIIVTTFMLRASYLHNQVCERGAEDCERFGQDEVMQKRQETRAR